MYINTIYFEATDGTKLTGILYSSEKHTSKIVLSIHGMATNCIKPREEEIARKLTEIGIDYLVFNNRGHDIVNYMKKNDGTSFIAGTAYENIEECKYDILGAIDYINKQKYDTIYLLGHSLGCTKVIYTYNELLKENKNEIINKIKGVILLSLVDIPKAIQIYLNERYPELLTYAKNMEKENMENILMPEKSFIYPISIKTFLQYTRDSEKIDFARYSDKEYTFNEINNIEKPLFMRWGNTNELILQKAEDLCEILKEKIKNEKLDIGYIDGADHNYLGKEKIIAEQISKFIQKIENT